MMTTIIWPFDPDETMVDRAQAAGHRQRTGHELEGWYVRLNDDFPHLARTCCDELTADDAYAIATHHDIIRQTALAEGADTHDRWGTIMGIGFTICDALAVRGEYVPAELQYRPAGLPDRSVFDLDAEEAEAEAPDHGDLYFAWGLGLGDNVMGSIDADYLREYLTGPWQAAYDALKAAGEDY